MDLIKVDIMGPLIPLEIITGQWDFVIALLIGSAFGFILEASGFSSSRNIAGVFYGYNFCSITRVFYRHDCCNGGLFIFFIYGLG